MSRSKTTTSSIGPLKHRRLILDIFEGHQDLSALARSHRLSPAELARWIGVEENQRCLSGLCVLADLQTQLMLSRYRQVAVSELIKQATGAADGSVSAEQASKACADLLKADLKRASPTELGLHHAAEAEAISEAEAAEQIEMLRRTLLGDEQEQGHDDHV